jgi:hypothetical protein
VVGIRFWAKTRGGRWTSSHRPHSRRALPAAQHHSSSPSPDCWCRDVHSSIEFIRARPRTYNSGRKGGGDHGTGTGSCTNTGSLQHCRTAESTAAMPHNRTAALPQGRRGKCAKQTEPHHILARSPFLWTCWSALTSRHRWSGESAFDLVAPILVERLILGAPMELRRRLDREL